MSKDIKIFSGNANPSFAKDIAKNLNIKLGEMSISRFADGEVQVEIKESVRGSHIFLIQSTCPPVNENYMELFIILDALKRSSVQEISLVMPYYGYARQDRKSAPRAPISAKCMADLCSQAGADRLLVADLHSPEIQGFFDIPVDNLFAVPALAEAWLKTHEAENIVCVSPDAGGMERVRSFAKRVKGPIAMIDKRRVEANKAKALHLVGDVEGKTALIVDDMIDTAGTLCEATDKILASGAKEVMVLATHGVLSEPAIERIEKSQIKEVFLTDTIPLSQKAQQCKKIKITSLAPLVGEAINRIFNKNSVSTLFK